MAGIGFELKKLFDKKSATGYFRGYFYTLVISAGPFVMLTTLIFLVQLLLKNKLAYFEMELYLLSVVYPVVFSQIAASGFSMVITRFLSDRLYSCSYDEIVPSIIGLLALVLPVASIPAVVFLWGAPLTMVLKLTTYILYMILIVIWIEGVYLSALKDYRRIVKSYLWGVLLALGLTVVVVTRSLMLPDLITAVMLAMDVGFFVTAVLLMINITRFFPEGKPQYFLFIRYLDNYCTLFCTNLFYTLGLYIPNIMMWQGAWAVMVADTYVYSPIYDVATFYAFLSILPVTAFFIIFTELSFYNKYTAYVALITGKGNAQEIEDAREDMLQVLWSQICTLIELQLAISFVFLALGNYLLPKIGLSYISVNVYNLLVLGAFSNGLLQIIIIFLLYFEDRKGAMISAMIFLSTNMLFNYISLQFGENTYGFGFFLSALISLAYALLRLRYYSSRIDYFIYCSVPVFQNVPTGAWSRLKAGLIKRTFSESK